MILLSPSYTASSSTTSFVLNFSLDSPLLCSLAPWRLLFLSYTVNLHAEYIMWSAQLDESQAGIKISGRNVNNLRYADGTTLMAENEEKLKNLLMKVKS